MKKTWWVSCHKMTILAVSEDARIVDTAPIAKKFVGQPLRNLKAWMEKFGGFKVERIG